ncbi:MAG TPA: GtrA family protein [Gaiellaceae bacterium]
MSAAPPASVRVRVLPPNTLFQSHDLGQLAKFCLVGAAGLAANLAVYGLLVHGGVMPFAAAAVAFVVAVSQNYLLNRYWTFRNQRAGFASQGARFLVVSLAALGLNVGLLSLLLSAALSKLPAQALAVVLVTPVNFLGNKLWSFTRTSALQPEVARRPLALSPSWLRAVSGLALIGVLVFACLQFESSLALFDELLAALFLALTDVITLAVADHVLTFRDDRFPGQCEYRTPVEVRRMAAAG